MGGGAKVIIDMPSRTVQISRSAAPTDAAPVEARGAQTAPEEKPPEAQDRPPDKPTIWPELGSHLTEDQKASVYALLDEFRDIFAFDMKEMTRVLDEVFRIPLTSDKPVFRKQYRLSYAELDLLKDIVEERIACDLYGHPWRRMPHQLPCRLKRMNTATGR